MYVLAEEVELRLPDSHSLKDRRQIVTSLVEGVRRRFGISVAEVGRQESWQRATIGLAVVASSVHQAVRVLDDVDEYIWARAAVEVLSTERAWLE